jgi:hypothetical protein
VTDDTSWIEACQSDPAYPVHLVVVIVKRGGQMAQYKALYRRLIELLGESETQNTGSTRTIKICWMTEGKSLALNWPGGCVLVVSNGVTDDEESYQNLLSTTFDLVGANPYLQDELIIRDPQARLKRSLELVRGAFLNASGRTEDYDHDIKPLSYILSPWICINICSWIADTYGIKRIKGDKYPAEIVQKVVRLNLGSFLGSSIPLNLSLEERMLAKDPPFPVILFRRWHKSTYMPQPFINCVCDMILILDGAASGDTLPLDTQSVSAAMSEYTKSVTGKESRRARVLQAITLSDYDYGPWDEAGVSYLMSDIEAIIEQYRRGSDN